MKLLFILTMLLPSWVLSQSIPSLSMEGGRGFIYTKSAETNRRGFLGLSFYGILSSIQSAGSRESLFSGVLAFTYGASDRLEFAILVYAVGRGVISDETISETRIESGLGESQFAMKYRIPLKLASADWAVRLAFHVPMGINFATHPSYPYDSDIYSLELMGLQTFHITEKFKIHINEGYRWRGLRPDHVQEVDLFLLTFCGSYQWNPKWTCFASITSNIELDDVVLPLKDRLVMTQGIQYGLGRNFRLNLAGSFRLNQERDDPLKTRAKNWRIFCGLSIGLWPSRSE